MTNKPPTKRELEENKKTNRTAWVMVVVLLLFVGGCAACAIITDEEGEDKGEKVGEDTAESTETEKETKTYKVGDRVKLGDNIITVKGVSGYTSSNEFMQPESGNKFIVVDVLHKNNGDNPISYNPLDFQLQDNKDYIYEIDYMCDKEPSFDSGTLQKGRQARGFLSFQIPKKNSPEELIFTPSWWSEDQVIIKLTK